MRKHQVDVLIIGAGPAGIFTALEMERKRPGVKILLVDKGVEIDKRKCPEKTKGYCIKCPVCSITSGWSGAGAFSDGKLSLSTDVGGRITDYLGQAPSQELIHYADKIYLEFGANTTVYGLNSTRADDIAYEASKHDLQLVACPVRHLGTEKAFDVLKAMHDYLVAKPNVEFWSLTKAQDLIVEENRITGATLKRGVKEYLVEAKSVVVAPGRGGAEWLNEQTTKLRIPTENNEVDVGVRVEVPNAIMDHLTKDLYEAKLVYYSDTYDNKVRTFCMNPGGVVSGEAYEGISVVNGHSYSDQSLRTQNTNFALLVSTKFTKPFNEPIEYGKYVARLANMLTGGGIMVQRLGDLLKGRRSDYSRLAKSSTVPTLKSAVPGDLSYVLPARYLTSIVETLRALDKIAPGMYSRNTLLYGVEVKFYSSKVTLNENFETPIKNLYTIGDGAGVTRGLMQASVNGIAVARDVVKKL